MEVVHTWDIKLFLRMTESKYGLKKDRLLLYFWSPEITGDRIRIWPGKINSVLLYFWSPVLWLGIGCHSAGGCVPQWQLAESILRAGKFGRMVKALEAFHTPLVGVNHV
jgi:hypothetical protein